jgi:hypothetical protein
MAPVPALAALVALAVILPLPGGAVLGRLSVGENPPRIEMTSSVAPDRIWPEGSGGEPSEARVDMGLVAAGDPSFTFEPQDTVFVMDRSGSMAGNDPGFLRVVATQSYIDRMLAPDRGCVVSFADTATLVNGHGLSSDYARIRADLATVGYSSGTNLEAALSAATAELESRGSPRRCSWRYFSPTGCLTRRRQMSPLRRSSGSWIAACSSTR